MPRRVRVMLIDDHPVVRAGVAALLETSETVALVAVCADPVEAIDRAVATRPDVILLDFMLQGGDGFDVARNLVERGVTSRLVMFTGHDHGLVLAKSALGEGFAGYLSKYSAPTDLESCVATVASGGYWMNGPAETVAL